MTLKQVTKAILHPQIFLLLTALLFLWYTLTFWSLNHVTENDLMPHSGVLIQMDTVNAKPKQRMEYRGLNSYYFRFVIDKEPGRMYYLRSFPSYDRKLRLQIRVGDTLTLFTLPQLSNRIFGLREISSTVHKLSKGDKLIYHDTALYYRRQPIWLSINLIASLTFFILFIFRFRKWRTGMIT